MNAYTAVPIGIDQGNAEDKVSDASVSKERSSYLVKYATLLVLLLIAFAFCKSKSKYPTLLPGGGRDWILDVTNGIISCKHEPKYALGSTPLDELVLTTRDDEENVIYFDQEELKTLQEEGSGVLSPLSLQFPNHQDIYSHWYYMLTGVVGGNDKVGSGSDTGLNVQYVDKNFIVFKGEYTLDVSWWKMVKGNTVNFVKVDEETEWKWWEKKQKTLEYGGGRDWVLNIYDGTISPKGHPSLVLGRGVRRLMLIDQYSNPDAVWHFDNLNELKSGGVVSLTDPERGGVAKMQEEEQYFQEWRYINSKISTKEKDAIQVKYIDENYLAIYEEGEDEEKALVLDVSFWLMAPNNCVNFVGGWVYE